MGPQDIGIKQKPQTEPETPATLNQTVGRNNLDRPVNKSSGYKINKTEALALALQGFTYAEIGTRLGCSPQAIHQLLAKSREQIAAYLAVKKNKSDFMEFTQVQLLNNLDMSFKKDNPRALSDYQKLIGVDILERNIRLIRNQSTDNTSTLSITLSLDEITAKRTELADEIASIKSQLTSKAPPTTSTPVIDVTPDAESDTK